VDAWGHLEALAAIRRAARGGGGMATVYVAEDLKHHRKVTVKVLRPEFAVTGICPPIRAGASSR
jgi:hypothetical protein